jgi:hypothetical protein
VKASVHGEALRALASDETRSSAPMPNSRLLPRRGTCVRTPHTARTCEPDHGALGFELRSDETFADGKMRWIEVAPAGGSTAIAIAPPIQGGPTSVDTRIVISTSDIEADHTALKAAGVDRRGDRALGPPPMLG